MANRKSTTPAPVLKRTVIGRALQRCDGTVLIGPVVWTVLPGHDTRCWYFVLGSADRQGYHLDQIRLGVPDREEGYRLRDIFLIAMVQDYPAVRPFFFEDELDMAELAALRWPCELSRRVLDNIRREREVG